MKILVAIQGTSPLLMNRFDEEATSRVSTGTSPIGVSRGTPRERAEPKLYLTADRRPMIPGPNVYRALIDAGIFHKVGKRIVTTARSSLIPAGITLDEIECPIENPNGGDVVWEVDSRSAVIPATQGRIMCHRPRFDTWRLRFTLHVTDQRLFDEEFVRRLVDDMGTKIGIGDFRPARKGPFGRFVVTNWVNYS